MSVSQILAWFQKAVPTPAKKNFNTQTGVHFEEVAEMLDALSGNDAESARRLNTIRKDLHHFATDMKAGTVQLSIKDPVEFVDAICDQVVTGIGSAHMANVDVLSGLQEVADSNDSKFDENGNPIFNEDMKIMKGPNYFKAKLEPYASNARFLAAPDLPTLEAEYT
ncbi:hypothetical protein KUV57_11840 [Epibacterium sp. DP7N7-1]|nr:hypothetical protein [Epibacterium sp. DP7N7-1]